MNGDDRQFPQTSSRLFSKNNQVGLKWKFFLFASIFKSCYDSKIGVNFVYLLFDFAIAAFSAYYPFGAATIPLDDVNPLNIFPNSKTFSFITPILFPTIYILVILCAFFVLFLIAFLICFFNTSYISTLGLLFYSQIHLIFYPLVSGTIGYCIYYITLNDIDSNAQFAFCLLDILLFLVYTLILSLLVMIEVNSFIQPNVLFNLWLNNTAVAYPTITAIISILLFQNERFSHTKRIVVFCFLAVFSLIICIYFAYSQPFLALVINEIFSVKYAFITISSIFSLVAIVIKSTYILSSSLTIIIVLSILSFFIIHISITKQRQSSEKILSQIGDPETLTVDALETIFESIDEEIKFQRLVKVGLTSGCHAVTNENFIRFVLEKFPDSNFFLMYVVILYSNMWGVDSDTYKFFLHLCSVDLYSFLSEFLLYQTTFCYMQASQIMSPLISRELETYRMSFLSLCQAHRRFWISCLEENGRDTKKFESARSEVLALFRKNYVHLKRLCKYYRYCPSIHYERSIFEADFRHKYDIASKYYHIADKLSRDPKSYISKMLFRPFFSYFSGVFTHYEKSNEKNEKEKANFLLLRQKDNMHSMRDDAYIFISCSDHNDRAQKIVAQLVTYDNHISKICERPVMIQKTQLQTEFKFFNSHIWFIRTLIVLVIIMYFASIFLLQQCNLIFTQGKVVYEHVLKEINSTLKFRKDIIAYQYNIMLLIDILNLTYEKVTIGSGSGWNHSENWLIFFSFAMKYLMQTERSLLNYKYVVDMFNRTYPSHEISDIYDYSDFRILFSRLHIMFDALSHTNKTLTEYIDTFPEILDIYIPSIITTTELVYFLIVKYFNDYLHSLYSRNKGYIISSFIIEFLAPFIAFWVQHSSINYIFTKVSSIIKTIQPPELKNIADLFKNTLRSEEHQNIESSYYHYVNPARAIFPTFLLLIIHPIIIAAFLISRNSEVKYKTQLFEYIPFTNSSRFVFYCEAFAMCQMYEKSLGQQKMSRQITEDSDVSTIYYLFGSDPFDINAINEINSSYYDVNYYIQCSFFDYEDNLFVIISLPIFILSLAFLCYYIYLIIISEKVASSGRYILYFIPPVAVNSNPVFQALIRGYHLSLNEVNTFSNELKKIPKFKGVFCTYFYNENNEIIDCYGDKKMAMPFYPKTIEEIASYYENKNGVHPSMNISEFFTSKNTNNTLRLTIEDDKDISVSFISNDQIFFRPELSNEEMIKKEKLIRYVNGLSDDAFPKKRMPISNGFLFAITNLSLENHKKLIQIAREQNEFFLFDTRNNSIFGAIDAKMPKAAHVCLAFLKNAPFESNAQIDYGGPMNFFDMPRGQFSKSRCVSDVYDVVYFLSTITEKGSLYVTKEFLGQLEPKSLSENGENENVNNNNDNDGDENDFFGFEINFDSIKLANEKLIKYAKINFNSIQMLIDNSDVKKVEVVLQPQLRSVQSSINSPQRFSHFSRQSSGLAAGKQSSIAPQFSGQVPSKISPLMNNPK